MVEHYHTLYGERGPQPAFSVVYDDKEKAAAAYVRFVVSLTRHRPDIDYFENAYEAIMEDPEVAWVSLIGPLKMVLIECEGCDDPTNN